MIPSNPAPVGDERDRLHAAIMNIRCAPKVPADFDIRSYALGHRDARHAAAELVSSSTVQQVGAEWQDIETAPKDGTCILVFPPMWDGRTCSIAKFNNDQFAKKPRPYWMRDDDLGKVSLSRETPPTHWMPLPSSPKSDGGKGS